jgi:hypothetical protein
MKYCYLSGELLFREDPLGFECAQALKLGEHIFFF